MTFEEWWNKNCDSIHRTLQTKNEYIKPFFENAYQVGWENAIESKERTAFQELKDLIDPEGVL